MWRCLMQYTEFYFFFFLICKRILLKKSFKCIKHAHKAYTEFYFIFVLAILIVTKIFSWKHLWVIMSLFLKSFVYYMRLNYSVELTLFYYITV